MDTSDDQSVQGRLILVTGGARSGKSTYAERLAARLAEPRGGRVIYLASPYTHSDASVRESRFDAACKATAELVRSGQVVFSPIAHGHPLVRFGLPIDWDYWARFDHEYLHVGLKDGRQLSIPLRWIPTLAAASPEEREKYEINRSRTMLVWDPAECAINDELAIADYLTPGPRL